MSDHVRGWTARVGLRKPMKDADIAKRWTWEKLERLARWMEANGARPERPPADEEWAGALLGQMRWPGDPDHVDALAEAMNRPIDHDLINRPFAGVRYRPAKGALLGPGSGIETPEQADRIVNALRGKPRPCCHTTGPNHHPACQEAK